MSTPAVKRSRPDAPRRVKTAKLNEGKVDVSVTFKVTTFMCADGLVTPLSAEPHIYDRNATSEEQLFRDVDAAFLAANPEFFVKNPHVRASAFLHVGDRSHARQLSGVVPLFGSAKPTNVFHHFAFSTTAEVVIYIIDAKALLDAWCAANNITTIPPFTNWRDSGSGPIISRLSVNNGRVVSGLPDIMNYAAGIGCSILGMQEPYVGASGGVSAAQAAAIYKLFVERPEVFVIEDKTMLAAFKALRLLQGLTQPFEFPKVHVLARRTNTVAHTRHVMTTAEVRKFKNPATSPAEREAILARTQKPLLFIELSL
jgi:hypothetical protein